MYNLRNFVSERKNIATNKEQKRSKCSLPILALSTETIDRNTEPFGPNSSPGSVQWQKIDQSCDVAEYSKRSRLDGVDWKMTRSLLVSWYISDHCIAISESFICLTTEACITTVVIQSVSIRVAHCAQFGSNCLLSFQEDIKESYLNAFSKLHFDLRSKRDIVCQWFEWINRWIYGQQTRNLWSINHPPPCLSKLTLAFDSWHQSF